jgi:hypothetical protein
MKNSSRHRILYKAVEPNVWWLNDLERNTTQVLIDGGADVGELNDKREIAACRNCKRLLGEQSDA